MADGPEGPGQVSILPLTSCYGAPISFFFPARSIIQCTISVRGRFHPYMSFEASELWLADVHVIEEDGDITLVACNPERIAGDDIRSGRLRVAEPHALPMSRDYVMVWQTVGRCGVSSRSSSAWAKAACSSGASMISNRWRASASRKALAAA